jgi:aryl-alcohol dehydrogenase-like predicted oxidoreductase
MKYRTIGTDPKQSREVSVLSLGAMRFGTTTDEATSQAILDRYVEAGGTFVDTSGNYAYWVNGDQGGQSEELLGRWRRSRGIGESVFIATKAGARPTFPGGNFLENAEGLSRAVIRASVERSMERMGVSRLDLLYAHIDDPCTPQEETVAAFGELVAQGAVGLLGVSNQYAWRVERARALAAAAGVAGYSVLQYQHSYLRQRADIAGGFAPDGSPGTVGPDLLSYVRAEPSLALVAYSPLLNGAYVRADADKPLGAAYDHAGTPTRLAALRRVARETGATVNQVVLAWLIGGSVPVIPLVGCSSVAQLDEALAAVDLELTGEQRESLDTAF